MKYKLKYKFYSDLQNFDEKDYDSLLYRTVSNEKEFF